MAYVKTDEPFLGVSPDGLFSCRCCGTAVLEAKCPYNIKDQNIKENYEKVLKRLKRSQRYYSQLTTEIALKGRSHGFIIVWPTVDYSLNKSSLIRTGGNDCMMLQPSFSKGTFYLFYKGKENCASALNATRLYLRLTKLTSQESIQCVVINATFGGIGIAQV